MMVVAVYALCVLAPNVALALTNAAFAVHCLTEPSNLSHTHSAKKSAVHQHADGAAHVHQLSANVATLEDENSGQATPGKVNETNCCGLFCVTALNCDGVALLPAPPPSDLGVAMPQHDPASLAPPRIYEPPIG